MADLVSYGTARRDIDQALIALKKGTRLLKYGRKGKPKFCPFRLSNDESSLIWISRSGERSLKLASVSRIIPGQRTVVFQRYLRPEKYYSSFSLIYNNGKHSVDVICKDKFEAEVWIAGLKALISPGQGGCSKIDGRSEGGLSFNENRRDLTSDSPSNGFGSVTQDTSSMEGESAIISTDSSPDTYRPENYAFCERSHVMLDRKNMQVKGSSFDAFRASASSAPSTSSNGSAADDSDGLGDVYIWGEVVCDNFVKVGPDKNANFLNTRTDVLLPRLLESDVVLDVHNVACGPRHAALVTRQGEVFTWGEESGGCLGHGTGKDVTHPRLVESLSVCNVNTVACGEFHTCAVTVDGELHTWGDGTHNAGLLGHGTDVSHWIPKRVAGTLEGLQVALVTCGPWHTALVTTKGQLFTFGDGTFGVLGHGDRENVLYPREVESLAGLRTVAVACGVWHTAAVVEVIATQSSASISSGKLFTWGDGDKNRLGHGDREARLKPTCVPPLIDYNFQKVACGHSLTVGLTTSGQIFTLGTTVYGQLGNPHADGKLPCLVEDKLVGESVGEIACGAYHVTVLTARNEVYTWGRGANGRLGHGDIEDRKTPALVEALRDRHVKYISCGSNYTAVICLNKWVSSSEQSQCSACRQAFGFTRKRHNCYNCGLAHCHSCSSRKASRVALAPNPGKPCRVCDSCYAKLSKVSEAGVNNRRVSANSLSGENKDRLDRADLRIPKSVMPSNLDLIKLSDGQAAKQGKKSDGFFHVALSHSTFLAVDVQQSVPKSAFTSSRVSSRSVSPLLTGPTCSVTPVPTIFGLSSESMTDSLKKSNELLNQEVHQLRAQVESLRQQYGLHASELQKSEKKAQEALALAAYESAELKAGNEAIQSLTGRIKDMAKRLPNGAYDTNCTRPSCVPNSLETNGFHLPDAKRECHSRADSDAYSISGSCFHLPDAKRECHSRADSEAYSISGSCFHLPDAKRECHSRADSEAYSISGLCLTPSTNSDNSTLNGNHNPNLSSSNELISSETYPDQQHRGLLAPNGARLPYENGANQSSSNTASETVGGKSGIKSSNTTGMVVNSNQVEAEWTEHYEPGVVITLVAFRGGFRDLRGLRFSRRIFGEQQAEAWWSENREKVYERYNICGPSGRGSQP